MQKTLPKLITIFGPTASGKSELAIKIAQDKNGEIVSADSRQIYRGLDIGTAKEKLDNNQTCFRPSKNIAHLYYGLVSSIPHYLIDIVDPNEEYTLSQYKKNAIKVINDIILRGKTPILAGGTGLYVQAISDNLQIPEVKPDLILRKKLSALKNEELYHKLKALDPKSAEKIDIQNKRRLIRAIEVSKITGKPFSKQLKTGKPLYNIEKIIIDIPREILYKKINKRVDQMFKAGLISEVKELLKKYGKSLPPFSGIGYQEVILYLDGKIDIKEAKELIKRNTRRYAKRQITWIRRR